jgi:hypothetical protein
VKASGAISEGLAQQLAVIFNRRLLAGPGDLYPLAKLHDVCRQYRSIIVVGQIKTTILKISSIMTIT